MRGALAGLAVALGGLVAGCGDDGASSPAAAAARPAPPPAAPASTGLSIAAAASLRELLEGTQAAFSAAHGGATWTVSFDASSSLSRQIESGAPFDVFLSADATNVDRLGDHIDTQSRRIFLTNRLALVGRADLPAPLPADPAALAGTRLTLALAGPAVPAGKYARAYLEAHGLLAALDPRVVTADSVKAAMALVEAGTADCGIVYVTDARSAKSAKLLWTAPPEDDPGIAYVAARVRASTSPRADELLEWLGSAEFRTAAEGLGFGLPAQ
jgi:molybdate transport system substrate-binding protein